MPYKLDNKGYQPLTPEELNQELTQKISELIPDFTQLPAELRNNLKDEATTFLVYMENLFTLMFNSYAPSQAPQVLFEMFANEQGLRRKGSYKSEVTIKFKGKVGFVIPKDLGVTNSDSKIVFKTYNEAVIGTTGEVNVLCYSDDDGSSINVGELNKLTINLDITATNIDKPTSPIEKESFKDFKLRCQARWKNPRAGTYEGLVSAIKGVDGVLQRGCTYKSSESGINLVVSGGTLSDIAYTIYKYGGITTRPFISQPSNNDTSRTKSQDLIIYNNSHNYKWTEAKNINLYIKITLKLKSITISSTSLQVLTEEKMIDYINNLIVGTPINKLSLTQKFLQGFEDAGGNSNNINQDALIFTIKNNDTKADINFDSNGFLNVNFDEYFTLSGYEVEITG